MTITDVADHAARLTLDAFDGFNAAFRSITRRAQHRFEQCDWQGGRRDAAERMDAYETALNELVSQLEFSFGQRAREQPFWVAAKERYALLVEQRYDIDRAETFFNSVTRKMMQTVGLNREIEFFHLHPAPPPSAPETAICQQFVYGGDTAALVRSLLDAFPLGAAFQDSNRDANRIAQEIDLRLWPILEREFRYSVETIYSLFFRNKVAYIVGRIVLDRRLIPLIIPLYNGPGGVYADTVLLLESDAKVVFSFAYAPFFVDVERYGALIRFLTSIMPDAKPAELYTSFGYDRHGKTEFYRDLHRFVHVSREQFIIAPGIEGAVMIAFTLAHYDFVFKVIKDRPRFLRSRWETSKTITKEKVRFQYDFVSRRDPAGRMVDTQEFENLRFRRKRFDPQLLWEFAEAAKDAVSITEEYVIIRHLYVQRKVLPLPMFFESEKDPEGIRRILIDFGYFLKDIAASGVFPCDLFNTWNYGVTPWGRVVLYDYDDVMPIERIRFREKPMPHDEAQENEPEENWIIASDEDFFMDEIDRYSGIPRPLKAVFASTHGDLYTLEFWNALMERVRSGEVFDVIPYDRSRRFGYTPAASAHSLPHSPA
ncbi:MAG: bifunctional isocitrate dehydrogenase kinase/phosphatase [Bacteroidota bacterium]